MVTDFIATFYLLLAIFSRTYASLQCFNDCHFTQSLDSPLTIPKECNKTRSDTLCQVLSKIDYKQNLLKVTLGHEIFDDRKRALLDKYDYTQETTTIDSTSVRTTLFYSCTLEDQCEGKFLLDTVSKVIKQDYTSMQQRLMDLLGSSEPSLITCRTFNQTVQCNGTCASERLQVINEETSQPSHIHDSLFCRSDKTSPNVVIVTAKVPRNNRTILSRTIDFDCSKNNCNSLETTDRVEKIVNENYKAFY
ncbi:unnamed protein product [Adineta ricciae]|uniref:Uncharacterized protein n=1 Tax=Adineta ricciae TaxID=249248 RepID=A0A813UJT9_ADIRI|nr:unnamed protein product [Adineta ricciae]CAF1481248.1 unnamed protein product [Adineta ricciae]